MFTLIYNFLRKEKYKYTEMYTKNSIKKVCVAGASLVPQ